MKRLYLIFYNLLSALGWAYVLFLAIVSVQNGLPLWETIEVPFKIVQTAAFLEVVHAFLGLVPSSAFATSAQVASRLGLIWLFVNNSTDEARNHWSLYSLVFSWCLVEIPRYLFYVANLLMKEKVPFPLFWLRYSLFVALYPSGIISEIIQILFVLPGLRLTNIPAWYGTLFIMFLYAPGAPFLYTHMLSQRKSALSKRQDPKVGPMVARPIDGIEYPKDERTGERSSTAVNKGAFEASLRDIDPKAAEAVRKERNWRFNYSKHIIKNVEVSARSPETCLKAAQAGLDYLHNTFEFHRGSKVLNMSDAMKTFVRSGYETGFVKGTKPKPTSLTLEVPYNGKVLYGKALLDQLNRWTDYGTIEPEARDAIAAVAKNPAMLDLSDKHFVLLGAGSAMGPLLVLLALGANVIAVDLDRPLIWKRLIGLAKDSPGTMTFPLKRAQANLKSDDDLYASAGCNLFSQAPEIRNWLLKVEPGKQLILGGYAYLDGVLFPKLAMAMDAIMAGVLEKRPETALAFLCSPTDCFVTPQAARKAAQNNRQRAPWWQKLFAMTGFLKPNSAPLGKSTDGKHEFPIVDGMVVAQGPNYALAKRLQHWRCMVARANGSLVSTNIAPSTATASVVHNKSFAAAYGGMSKFKPMEIMYQDTSNAVMAALLIYDTQAPQSVANPKTPLDNPLQLFAIGAFHGGVWRIGYKMNTIGPIAALTYYLKIYKSYILLTGSGLLAGISYFVVRGPPHTW